MPDRHSHWTPEIFPPASYPTMGTHAHPESYFDAIAAADADADREPEPPTPVMILDRELPSDIPRWAPALSGHEAPLVSCDGRGTCE